MSLTYLSVSPNAGAPRSPGGKLNSASLACSLFCAAMNLETAKRAATSAEAPSTIGNREGGRTADAISAIAPKAFGRFVRFSDVILRGAWDGIVTLREGGLTTLALPKQLATISGERCCWNGFMGTLMEGMRGRH